MWNDVNYGNLEDLPELLLYKRIVEWNKDRLVLEDGTVITLEESDSDCCAVAHGTFSEVELDAVITNIHIGDEVEIPDDDTVINEVKVVIYHNQNPIALAEMTADAGNGGYYYSVGSFVVNGVHFPIVRA
jgi:hypothetical protein